MTAVSPHDVGVPCHARARPNLRLGRVIRRRDHTGNVRVETTIAVEVGVEHGQVAPRDVEGDRPTVSGQANPSRLGGASPTKERGHLSEPSLFDHPVVPAGRAVGMAGRERPAAPEAPLVREAPAGVPQPGENILPGVVERSRVTKEEDHRAAAQLVALDVEGGRNGGDRRIPPPRSVDDVNGVVEPPRPSPGDLLSERTRAQRRDQRDETKREPTCATSDQTVPPCPPGRKVRNPSRTEAGAAGPIRAGGLTRATPDRYPPRRGRIWTSMPRTP
jgi:hypothetical protein